MPRVTPSRDSLEYLDRVFPEEPPLAPPAAAGPGQRAMERQRRSQWARNALLVTLLLIAAFLAGRLAAHAEAVPGQRLVPGGGAMVALAHGATRFELGAVSDGADADARGKRAAQADARGLALRVAFVEGATHGAHSGSGAGRGARRALPRTNGIPDSAGAEAAAAAAGGDAGGASLGTGREPAMDGADGGSAPQAETASADGQAGGPTASTGLVEGEAPAAREEPPHRADAVTGSASATADTTLAELAERVRQLERDNAPARAATGASALAGVVACLVGAALVVALALVARALLPLAARRRRRGRLGAAARRSGAAPLPPWSLGAASVCGMVRPENEDAFALRRRARYVFAAVADGLGGEPLGGEAARRAAEVARSVACEQLDGRRAPNARAAESALRRAFAAAGNELLDEAHARGRDPEDPGLRTTLVLVVALAAEVVYGYQGDGALLRVGRDGATRELLVPQRGESSNQVAACLGPTPFGEPCFGRAPRRPGDLFLLATDGIADRVEPGFGRYVLDSAQSRGGDLGSTATAVVDELARLADQGRFVFDDNLTLVLIGSGSPFDAPARLEPAPRGAHSGHASVHV